VHLDPNEIAFSMRSISTTFSGCGRGVSETLEDLLSGRIQPEDIPAIAVIAHPNTPKPQPPPSSKKGKRGKRHNDLEIELSAEESEGAVVLPASARFTYFAMNNRRLWVFRRAREAGIVSTIPCRLKPPDVCARLLDPVKKGSRSFRLDRVCDDARLVKGPPMQERPEPTSEIPHGAESEKETRELVNEPVTLKGEAIPMKTIISAEERRESTAQNVQVEPAGASELAGSLQSSSKGMLLEEMGESAVIFRKKEKRKLAKKEKKKRQSTGASNKTREGIEN